MEEKSVIRNFRITATDSKIQIFDVSVAKNYLTEYEMAQLQRLVAAYLDIVEDMALRKLPMTMQDWELRLNRFIEATDREILQDAGKMTAEIARLHAESEFEKYRVIQDQLFESDFDRMIKQSACRGEASVRSRKLPAKRVANLACPVKREVCVTPKGICLAPAVWREVVEQGQGLGEVRKE